MLEFQVRIILFESIKQEIKQLRAEDRFIIESFVAYKESQLSHVDPRDRLEYHGYHTLLLECLPCGRRHVSGPCKRECCVPNFQSEWIPKRVLQHNTKHSDKRSNPAGVTSPIVISDKTSQKKLSTREAEIEGASQSNHSASQKQLCAREVGIEGTSHVIKDEGDYELPRMMSEILDIYEEALFIGKKNRIQSKYYHVELLPRRRLHMCSGEHTK